MLRGRGCCGCGCYHKRGEGDDHREQNCKTIVDSRSATSVRNTQRPRNPCPDCTSEVRGTLPVRPSIVSDETGQKTVDGKCCPSAPTEQGYGGALPETSDFNDDGLPLQLSSDHETGQHSHGDSVVVGGGVCGGACAAATAAAAVRVALRRPTLLLSAARVVVESPCPRTTIHHHPCTFIKPLLSVVKQAVCRQAGKPKSKSKPKRTSHPFDAVPPVRPSVPPFPCNRRIDSMLAEIAAKESNRIQSPHGLVSRLDATRRDAEVRHGDPADLRMRREHESVPPQVWTTVPCGALLANSQSSEYRNCPRL
mmetsp:Transcript_1331/g.2787  ORF Transcript_1331/g.2787 Transcript_1331/m.2787 type:complete len:309 (-) Transcript_1331:33-959(-)